jgi:hypothetical protein
VKAGGSVTGGTGCGPLFGEFQRRDFRAAHRPVADLAGEAVAVVPDSPRPSPFARRHESDSLRRAVSREELLRYLEM